MVIEGICPEEKNTGLQYDPRFYESGLHANDYNIQRDNGVLQILVSESVIHDFSPLEEKEYR